MLQMIKTAKVAIPVNDGKALSHVHNTEEHNMDHKNNISYHTETTYETAIDDTITKLRILFPEQVTTEQINKIKNVAIEGYKLADSVYTAKDAEDWGDHYKVSEKLVNSDEKLFKASMRDIKAMTIRRQKKLIPNRLNPARVNLHTRIDNPERGKLMLLADLLREGFQPN